MPKSHTITVITSLKSRNNSGILLKRHTRHLIFKILTKNKTKQKTVKSQLKLMIYIVY